MGNLQPHSLLTVVQILQLSIAPVVLISGVGLIILSQANRMISLLNRTRQLTTDYKQHGDPHLKAQIDLLYERARTIRISLIALLSCILIDALVMLVIFISRTFDIDHGASIIILFALSILSLIVGLIAFIVDVNKNLKAVKIELDS